jgi:hypothetical protein
MRRVVFLILLVPAILLAQEKAKPDPWEPFRYFIGAWQGHEEGTPGVGKGERHYELVLQDKYIHFRNRSVFEPQEGNPEGEVHEDWGFFSYDRIRGSIVLRQFHVEGFVNQYVVKSVSPDGKEIVLISESIENLPSGWRTRYQFKILNENEFTELFELARPGQDFGVIVNNRWKRK